MKYYCVSCGEWFGVRQRPGETMALRPQHQHYGHNIHNEEPGEDL